MVVPGYVGPLAAIGAILLFVVVIAIMAIMASVSGHNSGKNSTSSAPAATPPGPNQPAAEAAFLASKDAIEARFGNAPNDMVKHQIAGEWQNGGSCPAVKSAQFTDWVGTIKTIQYDGTFEVDLGDNVLFHGSIDSASPLFKEVSALSEGDTVKVSGAFSMDQDGSECIAHASSDWVGNTDAGSVQSPIFDVLYSRVSAADSQ